MTTSAKTLEAYTHAHMQHTTAHTHAHMPARTHTRTHVRTRARTHTGSHAHTHTNPPIIHMCELLAEWVFPLLLNDLPTTSHGLLYPLASITP